MQKCYMLYFYGASKSKSNTVSVFYISFLYILLPIIYKEESGNKE